MTINRKSLIAALVSCGQAIKTRTTLPILTSVLLEQDGNNLRLRTTSLDVWSTQQVPSAGELDPCCVSHDTLLSILKLGSTEEVELLLDSKLMVKLGKSVTRLPVQPANEFPAAPDMGKGLAVNAIDLADALEATAWAVCDAKANRPNMENVIIAMSANELLVLAGNGYVLARHQRATICSKAACNVPGAHCRALAQALRETGGVPMLSAKHLSAVHDSGSVSVLLSEQSKPAFEAVLAKMEEATQCVVLPVAPMLSACEQVIALCGDAELPRLDIAIGNTVAGTNAHMRSIGKSGDYSDSFELKEPADGEIRIDAKNLKAILTRVSGDTVKVRLHDNGTLWEQGDLTMAASQLMRNQKA